MINLIDFSVNEPQCCSNIYEKKGKECLYKKNMNKCD